MKTFNYSTRSTRPDFQGDFLDMMLQATNKPNLISFAGGLPNPISFPTQEMAAATQKVLDQHGTIAMQYSIPEGYLPLRQFIAHQYLKQGIDISANDIIITNGSQQALDILSAVLIDEGDKILIEKPSYLAALQVFHLYNPKINSVTLNPVSYTHLVNKPVAPKAPPATPVNVCNAPSAVNDKVCLAVSTNA